MFMKYIKLHGRGTHAGNYTARRRGDPREFAECALHFHFTGKFARRIILVHNSAAPRRIVRDFRVISKLALHERLELKMPLGFFLLFFFARYETKFCVIKVGRYFRPYLVWKK